MSNRQMKCPTCGLANFRDAAECQWCALAFSGRTRNELADDMPAPSGTPWGLLLMLFALVTAGGGVLWHVAQKVVARAELAAEATGAADESEKRPQRAKPPSLSGRSPGDGPKEPWLKSMDGAMEKRRLEMERFAEKHRQLYEVPPLVTREEVRRNLDAQRGREQQLGEQRRAAEEESPRPPDDRDDW